jgi:hypothetical protein
VSCPLKAEAADPTRFPRTDLSWCGRWAAVPVIGYLSKMFGGVPVVATPAEIDVTTADQLRVALLHAAANRRPVVWWT